jgi:hypothetical protein
MTKRLPRLRFRFYVACIAFLATGTTAHAQRLDFLDVLFGGRKSPVDTNYIAEYRTFLTPRVFGSSRLHRFNLRASNLDYGTINYVPNLPPSLGVGAWYKNLGLAVSFQNPWAPDLFKNRLETRATDIQLNLYSRRFGIDLFWQDYSGYNIENFTTVFPGAAPDDPLQQRPDVRTFTVGGNFFYIFGWRKFSYRAAFIQTERQKKSAGSWMLLGGFNYNGVEAARPFLENLPPAPQPPQIPAAYYQRQARFYNLSVGGGYAHTFVVKQKFFVSAAAMPGVVFSLYDLDAPDGRSQLRYQTNVRLNLRGAAGYNGARYFGGISFMVDQYTLQFIPNQFSLQYQVFSSYLFVGRRFDMQGLFKKRKAD